MKTIIVVNGGIIQHVLTDQPSEVYVVDYDTKDAVADELTVIQGEEAYVYGGIHSAEVNPKKVEIMVEEINENQTN
ncbi:MULTISPECIES: hypothetical protein [Pseudobacillus]|uniref:hypothetical protein n=1 Tax=Pseudobacillus TaxID=108525 RepID=UPI003879645D